jgi:hypothetical protein
MERETGIVDLYSFFVVSANIRGSLGVVMKKNILLYPAAGGFGGVKVLEVLVYNRSRRF